MTGLSEHAEWLSLVDRSGPFLVPVVLEEAFPQGLDKLEAHRRQRLRAAYEEWRDAVDGDDPETDKLHEAWAQMVIQEALEYDDQVLFHRSRFSKPISYRSPEYDIEVTPDFAVCGDDGAPRLLIAIYAPETDLEKPLRADHWPASPAERMTLLCRANQVRIGLVTNGEQWMLINAPIGSTSGYVSWLARLWWQEPVTLRAFVSLMGVRRWFGPAEDTLAQLCERSLSFQEEVTDTLGEQVRQAVEVLIQALGRVDEDRNGELLNGLSPTELYEAGLTIMMRLVFILCAEERGLLLLGDPIYDQDYAISTLRAKLREDESQHGPEVLERRYDAWSRLLSVFRIVYGGIEHEILRMPALGGSLFDPNKFPFLEGRAKGTSWQEQPAEPLPIDNRTVLLLLTALQVLEQRGGAQLLSYRALDVEQIGHVYEGLLEYSVERLAEVTVGLVGSQKARHPIIVLRELESLKTQGVDTMAAKLADVTGRSPAALRNAVVKGPSDIDLPGLIHACGGDEKLASRLLPFAMLIRPDSWGVPLVYRAGSFAVVRGADRRETGTHYTPQSLTESIVEKTLDPIVHVGPADGKPPEEWRLKAAAELMDLKICDPAMGSGAFLVQACRYLAERLVEAWAHEESRGQAVTVDGIVVTELADKEPLPKNLDDRLIIARRLVAERCLYGVDLNPLAVELAKLSIWLVTLAKGRPFEFLDHNLRCGDSLLGIHHIQQLTQLDMNPEVGSKQKLLFGQTISKAVESAVTLREKLRSTHIRDINDVEDMQKLDQNARKALKECTVVADAFVGVVLQYGDDPRRLQTSIRVIAMTADSAFTGDSRSHEELNEVIRSSLAMNGHQGSFRRPFHWPLEYPEVFSAPSKGFNAVVGNPPFLNAISNITARSDLDKVMYARMFGPFAEGSYDLSLLFWARALLHLLSGQGSRYGLLSPTAMLSSQGSWKTWMHKTWRPDALTLYPNDFFKSARIRTTAIVGGYGRPTSVLITDLTGEADATPRICLWNDTDTNWYGTVSGVAASTISLRMIELKQCVDVSAGCTTADAYELKPLVADESNSTGLKLITTGAIDRFTIKWGSKKIRYLGDDYDYPRWPLRPTKQGINRAIQRQMRPKVIVAGYTAVLEACLDLEAQAAGVVQTWILGRSDLKDETLTYWLATLVGILNSAHFSRIFVGRHGSNAMTGKYIVIKKRNLQEMPIPAVLADPKGIANMTTISTRFPAIAEWCSVDIGTQLRLAALLAKVSLALSRIPPNHETWLLLDRLSHHLASVLYGTTFNEWNEDYYWWCDRVGLEPNTNELESILMLAERLI